MKSEEEVYNEIVAYINGPKHTRPSTLGFYKKTLRTPKIINLVFSRPDIFKLETEVKHVPAENMTDEILVKGILANPDTIYTLDKSLISIPVMVAFEFSKRRFEYLSALDWGPDGEKFSEPDKIRKYRDSIYAMCDTLPSKYNDEKILADYIYYISQVSQEIIAYCNSHTTEMEQTQEYNSKYEIVEFNSDKKIVILISGYPDAGKTTFSRWLAGKIRHTIFFDSDMLVQTGRQYDDFSTFIPDRAKVIIFSDIYADRWFTTEELGNALVVNILIEPKSIELMHRHSKHLQGIPFEEYKRNEVNTIHFDTLDNPIHVINDYTERVEEQVDLTLEEIAKRLGIEFDSINPNSSSVTQLKKTH